MKRNCIIYAISRYRQIGGHFVLRWTRMNKSPWIKWPHVMLLDRIDGLAPRKPPGIVELWGYKGYLILWRDGRRWRSMWTDSLNGLDVEEYTTLHDEKRLLPPFLFHGKVRVGPDDGTQ